MAMLKIQKDIVERNKDYNSKYNGFNLLKHACENGYTHVWE